MGRIRRPPSRKPHRARRDRPPERHRLVCRRRMDRHRHLVRKAETEYGVLCSYRIYGDTPNRVGLRGDLEKAEEEGRRADYVTAGRWRCW